MERRPTASAEAGARLARPRATEALWERIEHLQDAQAQGHEARALGRVPTPVSIARLMAERLLRDVRATHTLRLLDPGCGAGRLAAAALRVAARQRLPLHCTGIEIDAAAVRQALTLQPLLRAAAGRPAWKVVHADFLLSAPPRPAYDLLLLNPPYVSRRHVSTSYRHKLAVHHPQARRADLSALFLEHGLAWMRPGGRLCAIVPNKLLGVDYAAPLRRRLFSSARVEEIWDLAGSRVFPGRGVYPVILVLRAGRPSPGHMVTVYEADGRERARWPQAALLELPQAVVPLALPGEAMQLLRRLLTGPSFGDAVALGCGIATPGFHRALDQGRDHIICSGDIRPFQVRARRRFAPARVPLGARSLARQRVPKVVIPGMFLRLHAAFDARGDLLGRVYFVPVRPTASLRALLLALLNSRLYAVLYRGLFGAVAQAGGYLRLNAPYLRRLPWPQQRPPRQLATVVRHLERGGEARAGRAALDRRVEALFALDARERRLLGRLETLLDSRVEGRPRSARRASRQPRALAPNGPVAQRN